MLEHREQLLFYLSIVDVGSSQWKASYLARIGQLPQLEHIMSAENPNSTSRLEHNPVDDPKHSFGPSASSLAHVILQHSVLLPSFSVDRLV